MITPYDSVGNKCGEKGTEFEEYPYKHFTSLLEGSQNPLYLYYAVCVKECPMKETDYACIGNSEVGCKQSYYDTELDFMYCLPTKEDAQEALMAIYE